MPRFPDNSECTLVWEIRDFPLYLTLHQEELESPPFFIKCTEVIGWYLTLRLRGDVLDCVLYRLNQTDDLSDIQIRYRISVVGRDGTLHFAQQYTSKLVNEVRSVRLPDFIDTALIGEEHMPEGNLRLQCDLEVIVQNDVTTRWNFNNDLMELSHDMLRLYKTGQGSDRRIHVDGTDFRVHALVIAARCPALKKHFTPEDRPMDSPPLSPDQAITFERIQEFVRLLELPPKSQVQERSFGGKTGETFLKVFDAEVCDVFLNYLYSGRCEIVGRDRRKLDDDMKLRLLVVARHFDLLDLVRKLQEVEDHCTAVTELVTDTATLDFDLRFLLERNENVFEPITRLVKLSSTGKRYLEVTFFNDERSENCLSVCCRLLESALPVTLRVEIQVFHEDVLETPVETRQYSESFVSRNDRWLLPIAIEMTSYFRLKYSFTAYSHESVRMSRQKFSIPSTPLPEPKSLRQLRYDLAAALTRREHSGDDRCDLTLIAEGKMLRAHRLIVCARSAILKKRLEPVARQTLPNVEFDTLVTVVEYMYTGILFENDRQKVIKLLRVAEDFIMPELTNTCKKLLEA